MSSKIVAERDFTSVRRSGAIWAAATLLALLAAVLSFGYQGGRGTHVSREMVGLYSAQAILLGVLLPIVALFASYMAIAGERDRGSIKFLLSFPNSRRDLFLGKLASRLVVVAAIITFMIVSAALVTLGRYGSLPGQVVIGLFGLSLLYGSVFVSVAIAFSSGIASRSKAVGGAVGSYFVLVIFYVMPWFRMQDIVAILHNEIMGMDRNAHLYAAVSYTSPYNAFRKATNLIMPSDHERPVFREVSREAGDLPVYLTDEFSMVVFTAWLLVPLVVGYLRFERGDIQ